MKRLIPLKEATPPFFIALALLYFAILPKAQAVIPPPDGGYPGGNTAEGQNALLSRTTGGFNTALGWFSLKSLATGSFNTGVGAGTLVLNSGDQNTAVGTAALLFNSVGGDNTAVGAVALLNNTAAGNTAIGSNALYRNTTGGTLGNIQGFDVGPNVAVGWQALESNTLASANTAVGYQALHSFTTGGIGFEQLGLCTAVGFQALGNATGGLGNDAFGYRALYNNTDGTGNTASGLEALFNNTTGDSNTATGNSALLHNTTGAYNTANGAGALVNNATGGANVAIGAQALSSNTTGFQNTAVGDAALFNSVSGDANIALGILAGMGVTTAENVICIGADGANVSDSCYIGNIFGETSASGAAVYVNSNHKLGTLTSSSRFKDDIKPMERVSEALFALKPVTFHYKKEIDPAGMQQFGLVAEDVEKIDPDLVVRDKEGKPYSVRYEQVNAMLLNEFLKEHRTVQEQKGTVAEIKSILEKQEATNARQQKQIEALIKDLQKVSAELKVIKLPPQLVNNDY
jgi:Chaperone of endosialidase